MYTRPMYIYKIVVRHTFYIEINPLGQGQWQVIYPMQNTQMLEPSGD